MTDREIERHVARLVAGRTLVKVDGRRYLAGSPSREARLVACDVEDEAYREAVLEGCPTREQAHKRLVRLRMWNADDDKLLEALTEKVPKLQVDLYEARNDPGRVDGIRRILADVRRDAAALEARKASLEPHTAEYAALSARALFLTGASLRNLDGSPFWPDLERGWEEPDRVVEEALAQVAADRLPSAGIREVARSHRWRSSWSARNVAAGLTDVAAVDLDDEMNSLLHWSELYEQVARVEDPPEESVTADDDMFDGWLTLRRAASDDARLARRYREKTRGNAKIEGADEVFLIPRDDADAKDVNQMLDRFMDPEAKATKKRRLAYVDQRGDVNELLMPDTKQRLEMEFAAGMAARTAPRR